MAGGGEIKNVKNGSVVLAGKPGDKLPKKIDFKGDEPKHVAKIWLPETSDITGLPDGRFLAVSDKSDALLLINPGKNPDKAATARLGDFVPKKDSQLEAAAYDRKTKRLFVAREEDRELIAAELDLKDVEDGKKSKTKKLDTVKLGSLNLDGRTNKGVEGMAFLEGDWSPDGRPHLILAPEFLEKKGKRMLALVDVPAPGKEDAKKDAAVTWIEVDEETAKKCDDFSAMAIDPKTGVLFLASEESATIAQVALVREKDGNKSKWKTVHLDSFKMKYDGKNLERVEGIGFDPKGDLFLMTESTDIPSHLYKWERK